MKVMLKKLRTENAILYTIKFLLKIAFGYTVSPTLEFLSEDNIKKPSLRISFSCKVFSKRSETPGKKEPIILAACVRLIRFPNEYRRINGSIKYRTSK